MPVYDSTLARRERQILEVLHRLGSSSVAQVRAELPDPPSYSAVRTHLGILVVKGHARRRKDGRRFVYAPAEAPGRARRSAVRHLVATFFEGSTERAVAALLDSKASALTAEELDRIEALVEKARKEGR